MTPGQILLFVVALAAFGVAPTSMDTILPTYMWRFRKHGQFDKPEANGTSA